MAKRNIIKLTTLDGKELSVDLATYKDANASKIYKLTGLQPFKEKVKGDINIVFYDPEIFEVKNYMRLYDYLHFKGGDKVVLPVNCHSCLKMFEHCTFPEGFVLNIDTSAVKHMYRMFYKCHFSDGVTFGDSFDTSLVSVMNQMFFGCYFGKTFNIGNKFKIGRNTRTLDMFTNCSFSAELEIKSRMTEREIVTQLQDKHRMPHTVTAF